MPPGDPELRFEQVLARHLRRGTAHAGCLDAENLAAYHESALTPAEMAACKEHMAACARCQQALEALKASEAVPIQEESVLVAAAAPAAVETRRAADGSFVKPVGDRARARPVRLWQWLVPAAAVAAGIVIWIGVRESHRNAKAPVEVAMNAAPGKAPEAISPASKAQPQAAPKSAQPMPKTAPLARATESSISAEGRTAGGFAAKPQAASGGVAREESQRALSRVAAPSPAEGARQADFGNVGPQSVLGAISRDQAAPPKPSAVPPAPAKREAATENEIKEDKDLSATTVLAETDIADTTRVRSDQRTKQAASQEKAAQEAAGKLPVKGREAAAVDTLRDSDAKLRTAAAAARPITWEIAEPGGRVLWRTGDSGQIEKSADGGAAWARQSTGVTAELLAGAAPSEQVCWIVGRAGTVLRTTDGEHWARIPFPFHLDLGGVAASDDLHALVWDTQGKMEFETSDGGGTWTRADRKE